jgi:uridine nucleosidase
MTIDDNQIPLWLDCDTGNDDVFAILFAAFHPRIKLVGISTVHGNAPLQKTTHNTLAVLDIMRIRCNVYPGESHPLVNRAKFAGEIHGAQGLGGVVVPEDTESNISTDLTYLEAMKQAIEIYEGSICVVCTGTLTNFSKLLSTYPGIDEKIRYVSVMGGGVGIGNVTEYAEFNFNADPHAAHHVISTVSPRKVILAPLNLTHQVRATEQIRNLIYNKNDKSKSSDFRLFFYSIMMFFNQAYIDKYGINDGPPIHDPVAVYSLFPFVDDDFEKYGYECLQTNAEVIQSGPEEGMLVIDTDGGNEVFIGEKVDTTKFWNQLLHVLELAEANAKRRTHKSTTGVEIDI